LLVSLGEIMETISREMDMPFETACEAVEQALAASLEAFFNAEVQVRFNLDRVEAWMFTGHRWVPIRWDRLPADFISAIKNHVLPERIQAVKAGQDYAYWRARRHTAVEGVILRARHDRVEVDIGGHVGIMEKRHFVPGEVYRQGRMLRFYVLKVLRPCRVFLSRNTLSLPEALLRQEIPWGHFVCTRRIAGVRSEVTADVAVPGSIIRQVAAELGEVLELWAGTKKRRQDASQSGKKQVKKNSWSGIS